MNCDITLYVQDVLDNMENAQRFVEGMTYRVLEDLRNG